MANGNKLDLTVDTDYKSLYKKTRLNLMQYANELTDLEEKFEQLKFELQTARKTGLKPEQIERIIERVCQD